MRKRWIICLQLVRWLFGCGRLSVRAWCNIPPIFAFDFKDLMGIHNVNQGKNEEDYTRVGYYFVLVYLEKQERVTFQSDQEKSA
ncbi:hypothetical protein HanIR_Chr14g0716221 [Helianthus annuus]|nr:hypothetical protein HanIR_Chr14g0716221 [Helianthus annuus]